MSKKSVINRNHKRQALVTKLRAVRADLKKTAFEGKANLAVRNAAFVRLQKLPRDSSRVRFRNRCFLTGRPRSVFRRFGIARGKLREMVMNGEIPGIIKSSW